jgi:pilus assembly protein CpaE
MIIIEHDGPIEAIKRLAEVSAVAAQVIVLGHVNDIGRYRRLLDEGVSDYLFLPVTPEFLLTSIARAFAQADDVRTGMVVTFLPTGGGRHATSSVPLPEIVSLSAITRRQARAPLALPE